jgi:hypothetical protein
VLYFWFLNNRKISLLFKKSSHDIYLNWWNRGYTGIAFSYVFLIVLYTSNTFLSTTEFHMFFPLKRFKLTKHQKPLLLCFWQRFLSISGILIHRVCMILHKSPGGCCYICLKMSTCPRCGTGNFKEGRSLSMHLSRFCSGPTLLCNTLTGLLPSKRSM